MFTYSEPVQLLHAIGMPPKYRGFAYLTYILHITKQHPEYIYQITTKIYPMVIEKYQTGKYCVEKNIRFAIRKAWENGNKPLLNKIFNTKRDNWPPTNSEFISTMTLLLFSDGQMDVQMSMEFLD